MGYNGVITFGGLTLTASNITPVKIPATTKQRILKRLIMLETLSDTQDWQIEFEGFIATETFVDDRVSLELLDDNLPHDYDDGHVTGIQVIIVPGSLQFQDTNTSPVHYTYSMRLIQFQQVI